MNIQDYFDRQISSQQFGNLVHQQHYSFTHKIMPYVLQNHFNDLVRNISSATVQDWILNIWLQASNDRIADYGNLFFPKCHFFAPIDDINVIALSMPAPRIPAEAAYIALVFIEDKTSSFSEWIKLYFTLELGLGESAFWVLAEWSDSTHINLGEFEYQPTLENFVSIVETEVKNRLNVSSDENMSQVQAIARKYGISLDNL